MNNPAILVPGVSEAAAPKEGGTAEAIHHVAESVTDVAAKGGMGIRGLIWNNVGNMTGMSIIAFASLYLGHQFIQNARESNAMIREEIKFTREQSESRFIRTEATHGKAMERMGDKIERCCTSMENATRALEKVADKNDP